MYNRYIYLKCTLFFTTFGPILASCWLFCETILGWCRQHRTLHRCFGIAASIYLAWLSARVSALAEAEDLKALVSAATLNYACNSSYRAYNDPHLIRLAAFSIWQLMKNIAFSYFVSWTHSKSNYSSSSWAWALRTIFSSSSPGLWQHRCKSIYGPPIYYNNWIYHPDDGELVRYRHYNFAAPSSSVSFTCILQFSPGDVGYPRRWLGSSASWRVSSRSTCSISPTAFSLCSGTFGPSSDRGGVVWIGNDFERCCQRSSPCWIWIWNTHCRSSFSGLSRSSSAVLDFGVTFGCSKDLGFWR